MRYLLIVVLVFSLGSCTKDDVKDNLPENVLIPVAQKIEPVEFSRPDLPIQNVTPSTPDEEVKGAYAKTVDILKSYVEFLEGIINTYRTKEMKEAVEKVD